MRGNSESQMMIASHKASHSQYSQWIFAEGFRNMPEYFVGQILLAAIGVNEISQFIFCDGIDGEVAAL